jgi:hypothetical protein
MLSTLLYPGVCVIGLGFQQVIALPAHNQSIHFYIEAGNFTKSEPRI